MVEKIVLYAGGCVESGGTTKLKMGGTTYYTSTCILHKNCTICAGFKVTFDSHKFNIMRFEPRIFTIS